MHSSACVNDAAVELNDTITEDTEYTSVHQEFTRGAEIYRDFESRFRITATYLSPKFRGAFSKRLKELFTQEHPSLDEAAQNAGFFVTIQSPDENEIDLNDPHLWTIFMDVGNVRQNPILIKRIQQKERWNPFFSSISKWSREYLIIFDTASIAPNSPDMVEKSSVQLTFANSDAKVKMNW
jgi:hypothetical protein